MNLMNYWQLAKKITIKLLVIIIALRGITNYAFAQEKRDTTTAKIVQVGTPIILEEFVVVGYGIQRKSDVTGSIAKIGKRELQSMPLKNAIEALQGRTAGVDVTSNQRPGEVPSIQIRGVRSISASSAPLYVVDGIIILGGAIENISTSDIESIEILKDASATAIYGSRGANGVVMISTKQGKKGKTTLSYSGNISIDKLYDVSEKMNSAEWLDYSRYAIYNATNGNGYTYADEQYTPTYESDYKNFGGNASSWANIEKAWVDGVYHPELVGDFDWKRYGKRTGYTNEHNINISGGNDTFSSYASLGHFKQTGTQTGQDYTRYTMKASVTAEPISCLKIGISVYGTYGKQNYGCSRFNSAGTTSSGEIYAQLSNMVPWSVPYDEQTETPTTLTDEKSPINENAYTTDERKTLKLNGNMYAAIYFSKITPILDGWYYRIQFGPEFKHQKVGQANAAKGIIGNNNNIAMLSNSQTVAWTIDNIIIYKRNLLDTHDVKVTFMQSASEYKQESGNVRTNAAATSEELWHNISSGGTVTAGTNLTEKQMASYMMRVNYGYNNKYLLTASMRWDGASQLSEGHQWETFPSLALGWRIDQEEYVKAIWISNLKLRVGIGETGNAAISAYATKGGIQNVRYNWGEGESVMGNVASIPEPLSKVSTAMANQNLGWERTLQLNIGVDFGLIGNRLHGTIDYYNTKTHDLLLNMALPSLTGYTTTYANVGETSGWGIDLQLGVVPVVAGHFSWQSDLTWSIDRDKIEKLANGKTSDINNNWFVGEEIGVYYDYVYDGIWKTSEASEAAKYGMQPGMIRVKDLNDDGLIDESNDLKIVGHIRPRWTGGWTNTLSYKDISLSAFIITRWGFTIKHSAEKLQGLQGQRKVDYFIAGKNEDAKYPMPGLSTEYYSKDNRTRAHSLCYDDGSFVKMRNISLSYTFTNKWQWIRQSRINMLRLSVQAQNPFMIFSKCKWLDTDNRNYDTTVKTTAETIGTEYSVRSLVFGLNLEI